MQNNQICININGVRKELGCTYDVCPACDEISKNELQHDVVGKSTSKQQVCISNSNCIHHTKNWTHTLNASWSYGRPPGRQALYQMKIFLF